jgi:hypothetical protein
MYDFTKSQSCVFMYDFTFQVLWWSGPLMVSSLMKPDTAFFYQNINHLIVHILKCTIQVLYSWSYRFYVPEMHVELRTDMIRQCDDQAMIRQTDDQAKLKNLYKWSWTVVAFSVYVLYDVWILSKNACTAFFS